MGSLGSTCYCRRTYTELVQPFMPLAKEMWALCNDAPCREHKKQGQDLLGRAYGPARDTIYDAYAYLSLGLMNWVTWMQKWADALELHCKGKIIEIRCLGVAELVGGGQMSIVSTEWHMRASPQCSGSLSTAFCTWKLVYFIHHSDTI